MCDAENYLATVFCWLAFQPERKFYALSKTGSTIPYVTPCLPLKIFRIFKLVAVILILIRLAVLPKRKKKNTSYIHTSPRGQSMPAKKSNRDSCHVHHYFCYFFFFWWKYQYPIMITCTEITRFRRLPMSINCIRMSYVDEIEINTKPRFSLRHLKIAI